MTQVFVRSNIKINLLPRCIINMPGISSRKLKILMTYTLEREREYVPRDSGDLAKSIHGALLSPESGYVRAGGGYSTHWRRPLNYGPFQEYGTSHNPPQPFVRPAASDAASYAKGVLGGNIEGELLA